MFEGAHRYVGATPDPHRRRARGSREMIRRSAWRPGPSDSRSHRATVTPSTTTCPHGRQRTEPTLTSRPTLRVREAARKSLASFTRRERTKRPIARPKMRTEKKRRIRRVRRAVMRVCGNYESRRGEVGGSDLSRALPACHRRSISSRDNLPRSFPSRRTSASIAANRTWNFRVAR